MARLCYNLSLRHESLQIIPEAEIRRLATWERDRYRRPCRSRENEITVCDLTGVGVPDTAIADFVYKQLR